MYLDVKHYILLATGVIISSSKVLVILLMSMYALDIIIIPLIKSLVTKIQYGN